MKIWLIADDLTTQSLALEERVSLAGFWKRFSHIDFLLVESAWQGPKNRWKYKIASYPDYPKRNNLALQKLVTRAKDRGIPTVFWNKEDGVHFDRFIDSASLFDHVFTVDSNMIPRYKAIMGETASIHPLMFAVQPKIHHFTGFHFQHYRANFVGSYSQHIHPNRQRWQDLFFDATAQAGLGVTIFDRNSHRKSNNYRYPEYPHLQVKPRVKYVDTAQIYRDYLVSLNVNTVMNSPTMFSRRLVEILACGGIAVTTPADSVNNLFQDYCYTVHNQEEMISLFERLQSGPSSQDLERARAGAEYVAKYHTWDQRLAIIQQVIDRR